MFVEISQLEMTSSSDFSFGNGFCTAIFVFRSEELSVLMIVDSCSIFVFLVGRCVKSGDFFIKECSDAFVSCTIWTMVW